VACGFIGTNLIKRLVEQGYRVKVPDNLSVSKARAELGFKFGIELTDGIKQLWQASLNEKSSMEVINSGRK
jgi:nucleoside-diphosphate-sugar epimerase